MAERKHRCGGTLVAGRVQIIVEGKDDLTMAYLVHGLICDKCHEQLIDRETALQLQASQTPTIVWHVKPVASTRLDAMKFNPLTASTATEAVA